MGIMSSRQAAQEAKPNTETVDVAIIGGELASSAMATMFYMARKSLLIRFYRRPDRSFYRTAPAKAGSVSMHSR